MANKVYEEMWLKRLLYKLYVQVIDISLDIPFYIEKIHFTITFFPSHQFVYCQYTSNSGVPHGESKYKRLCDVGGYGKDHFDSRNLNLIACNIKTQTTELKPFPLIEYTILKLWMQKQKLEKQKRKKERRHKLTQ